MADIIQTEQQDQPKPKFNLLDLEAKLALLYDAIKLNQGVDKMQENLKQARSIAQELLAIIVQCKANLDSIEMPIDVSQEMKDALDTESIQFHVVGAQLFENGKLSGVALYTTVHKARKIKDICNKKFAELRVNHEVKLLTYPVY